MMKWVFGADTGPFKRGLDDMRSQTTKFASSAKGMIAGALGVGAVIGGIKKLVDEISRIQDLATRFGESAESMQRVGLAAQLAGSDIEGIAKAMTVVTKNAYEAAQKGGAMGEAFAALGMNAGEFVNLPIEQKILELAKGFENGKGSGENLALVMKVLGKSGAEMMPLLSQGLQELQTQFANTTVVSNSTVASLENFGDQWDSFMQKLSVGGAAIIEAFMLIGGTIGASIGGSITQMGIAWDTAVTGIKNGAAVIGFALTGNFSKAGEAFERYKNGIKKGFDETKNNIEATGETVKEVFDEIYNKPVESGANKNNDALVEGIEEAIKSEEERKKLAEEIAGMQKEARMKDLSLAEQILEIDKERAALIEEMNNATGNDKLQKEKEILENEKKRGDLIDKRNKEAADAASKESDKIGAEMERWLEAKKQDEESKRNRAFETADPAGKVDMLKAEQANLLMDAKEAGDAGDQATQIDKTRQAREKGYEMQDILKDLADTKKKEPATPMISTGSLASIGAGGSANLLTGETIQQRQLSVLETIAQNTSRTQTGNANIPEPV
jgi:hypothetical protein